MLSALSDLSHLPLLLLGDDFREQSNMRYHTFLSYCTIYILHTYCTFISQERGPLVATYSSSPNVKTDLARIGLRVDTTHTVLVQGSIEGVRGEVVFRFVFIPVDRLAPHLKLITCDDRYSGCCC
jgi:hypothetical protein